MSDLVERLREHADATLPGNIPPGPVQTVPRALLRQAADALTELGRIAMETATDLSCLRCDTLEATSRALALLACRGDPADDHYCPNCDNSTADARVIIDVLHARLTLALSESPVPNESPPSGDETP